MQRAGGEVNGGGASSAQPQGADALRLTPRTLELPERSPVVQAYLEYLHALTLCTPLQLHPPVLAALVVFAKTYSDDALRAWCVHALHGVLEQEASAAPLVYEAATIAGCTALQIRALRTMLVRPPSSVSSTCTRRALTLLLRRPQSSPALRARSAVPPPSAAAQGRPILA